MIKFKRKINKSTIKVGEFNSLLTVIDPTRRQKIGTDREDLNNLINEPDLIDIYRTLHSTAPRTVTKIGYIMGHTKQSVYVCVCVYTYTILYNIKLKAEIL